MASIPVKHEPQARQFQAVFAEGTGLLDYRRENGLLYLIETRVPPELEGRGIGSGLVKAALDEARAQNWRVFPICPFARAWLVRHPEYQDSRGFYEILAGYDPPVQELMVRVRGLIYEVYPPVVEVPWVQQKTIGYGVGPKKMSEHFAWMQPQKSHVNLGFNYGSELPDPAGLLEGTGKLMRHVKINRADDVENPAVRALVEAASRHRMPARPNP